MYKPTTIRSYFHFAEETGFDLWSILTGSGVSREQIENLEPMSLATMADILDRLARSAPPGFAVDCGRSCHLNDYGLVGFTVQSLPTVRDAFEGWQNYALLAGVPVSGAIVEQGERWHYEFTPRMPMSLAAKRLCVEVCIAAIGPVIEELSGQPARTIGFDFDFPRPDNMDIYKDLDTGTLRFGQAKSRYTGIGADLDRQVRWHSDELSSIFAQNCEKFMAELSGSRSYAARVEDILSVSAGEVPTIVEMSEALNLSPRSLQRHLQNEGYTYVQVVRQFREHHAKQLLRDAGQNVKAVAFLLGFKDTGSFRRAFREWTDMTVSEWLASEQGPELLQA